jgi:pyruvate/2-oxoglutarate dehydrogenase complex dihydrolipoamide dehydrogenase (E3) component
VVVGEQTFTARRGIVIATGSRPVIPPVAGLDKVAYWTTHDVIAAETLPASLIVLGGGVVGCELGQLLSRFGVQVTIVEAAERLLPGEEPEASQVIEDVFGAEGITVHTGARAQEVTQKSETIVVTLASGEQITGERLLVATGRQPNTGGLGLETIGLDEETAFVPVDEHLRVTPEVGNTPSTAAIWAMGDVTGKAMFTHVALYQSAIVAADILGLEHAPARYDAVPRAAFTDPEVGAVGLSEAQARATHPDMVVVVKQLPATFRGWLHGSGNGVIKLVADRQNGVLLGATVVGPRGGDMLGLLNLAVHARLPISELSSMIYAFPTFYGAIGEAIGAYGRGLSTVIDPGYAGFKMLDEAGAGDGGL